jgi:hypothetical protein
LKFPRFQGPDSLGPPDDEGGDGDRGHKGLDAAVEAGCDATLILEAADRFKDLHHVRHEGVDALLWHCSFRRESGTGPDFGKLCLTMPNHSAISGIIAKDGEPE